MHAVTNALPSISKPLRFGLFAPLVLLAAVAGSVAQSPSAGITSSARPAADESVIPQQIQYTASLPGREGDRVEAVFRIYAAPEGGEPLWTETQRVAIGIDGRFQVMLGAATEHGLPSALFAGGQARWLGISVERAPELPRTLLASVPYAMKSADAATLAGRAAADYVTREELRAAVVGAPPVVARVHPEDPSGFGTSGFVPLWTGVSNLGNSVIAESGTKVGIDTASPTATLDVAGTTMLEGSVSMPSLGTATASGGVSSPVFAMIGSTFQAGGAAINQKFAWEVQAQGNNTSNPSSSLSLLYASGTKGVTNTGLYFLPSGSLFTSANVTTAAVPATASAANASPRVFLQGSAWNSSLAKAVQQNFAFSTEPTGNNTASPSGNLSLQFSTGTAIPADTGLSFAPNGLITFANGQTFPGTGAGTITAVNTSSPITGGGTSGAVSVGLNEATLAADLEPTYDTVYPQLNAANTFAAGQTINAPSAISGNTAAGASPILTATNAGQGPGIAGYTTQGGYSIGIFGAMNPSAQSGSYGLLFYDDGFGAGIWADGINHGNDNYSALIATADDMFAGNFFNNSANLPTISVLNNNTNGSTGNGVGGIATVLRAGGPDGVCGINQSGSIACTGQIKTLVTTRGSARQVETYAVQSAENWLEDYGSGRLEHGSVTVALDPAFAETVNTGVDFHVFLTPGGDCKGLYVSHKTATGFEVHELGGGKSNIPFDYKIVAKRTGHEVERLVDVTERMRVETESARPKPRVGGPAKGGFGRVARQTHD